MSVSEQRQLEKLAVENIPTRVIGLKFGRTPSAVSNQASKQRRVPQTDESVALRHLKEEVIP